MIDVISSRVEFGQWLVMGSTIRKHHNPGSKIVIPLNYAVRFYSVDDEKPDEKLILTWPSEDQDESLPVYDDNGRLAQNLWQTEKKPIYGQIRDRCDICPARCTDSTDRGVIAGDCMCRCTGAMLTKQLVSKALDVLSEKIYYPNQLTVALIELTAEKSLSTVTMGLPRFDHPDNPGSEFPSSHIFECGLTIASK